MKVYFPSYYKEFKCIADKCRHSCCIGWEIGVDPDTMERYRTMEGRLGDNIRSHLDREESVIKMCDNGRCPFLDDEGLCRIISAVGEENTSVICREHPRFYHQVMDRVEGGIGASCEEACRIILSSGGFSEFVEMDSNAEPSCSTDFDSLTQRNYIFTLLGDKNISYSEKVKAIREKYNIPDLNEISFDETFSSLEYLDEGNSGRFATGKIDNREPSQKYFTRFLAYLVFRHVSVAENIDDLRVRVAFCILLSNVFESLLSGTNGELSSAVEIARVISEEIEYSEDNTQILIMEMWSIT